MSQIITYNNLRNDPSLQQTYWTGESTSGSEYNMITGWERGGSYSATVYVLASCFHILLRSRTWGFNADSITSATAYPYDPVTRSWLEGYSWSTAWASGINQEKTSTTGHNYVDTAIESMYPQYSALHLWKIDFSCSHSGANTGSYNYCIFYPSYRMSEGRFDSACRYVLGDPSNGLKGIVPIQPRIMYIDESVSKLTPFSGEMWRCKVPSEQYIINTFVDHQKGIFRDPFLRGIPLDGVGDILNGFRPNTKNICWSA